MAFHLHWTIHLQDLKLTKQRDIRSFTWQHRNQYNHLEKLATEQIATSVCANRRINCCVHENQSFISIQNNTVFFFTYVFILLRSFCQIFSIDVRNMSGDAPPLHPTLSWSIALLKPGINLLYLKVFGQNLQAPLNVSFKATRFTSLILRIKQFTKQYSKACITASKKTKYDTEFYWRRGLSIS